MLAVGAPRSREERRVGLGCREVDTAPHDAGSETRSTAWRPIRYATEFPAEMPDARLQRIARAQGVTVQRRGGGVRCNLPVLLRRDRRGGATRRFPKKRSEIATRRPADGGRTGRVIRRVLAEREICSRAQVASHWNSSCSTAARTARFDQRTATFRSDTEGRVTPRPCGSLPPLAGGRRGPGRGRGTRRLQRILNHHTNRSRRREVPGVTGPPVGCRCQWRRGQILSGDTTGVRVGGLECRELDLRVVPCVRTRQRRRGVSSRGQRWIIGTRG
jgi:hypothetical protein